jgi:endonuclease YncB( thermonuclease family)
VRSDQNEMGTASAYGCPIAAWKLFVCILWTPPNRAHAVTARMSRRPTSGLTRAQAIELGRQAKIFTASALAKPFTTYTRWRRALGRSANWRYYAIIVTADGRDLNELLVSAGLARIYGTRTPLPDGRDSRTYLAHLHELENEARAAKRGAWNKVHQ